MAQRPLGDPSDPPAKVVMFRVARKQAEQLDRLREQSGKTPSELLRAALDRYLLDELQEAQQAS